jgi:hypothetical protein
MIAISQLQTLSDLRVHGNRKLNGGKSPLKKLHTGVEFVLGIETLDKENTEEARN